MNILKLIPAVALTLGLAFASYAENKNEVKEPTEAKTEVKSDAQLAFTYYVVGKDDMNNTYELSPNPPTGGCPNTGSDPCQISTDQQQSDLEIDQDEVDNQNGVQIHSRRTLP